jgi:hypothetical protein
MDRPLLETALDDGGNVKRQLSGYRLGETIAASTTGLTVECYQDREHLVLGQLVHAAVGTGRVLGIVTTISNVPIDSSRRPAARGENSEDEEALRRAHPELSRLVRTEFEAILVGYETENDAVIHHGYPPRPPDLHSFVYVTDSGTARRFMEDVSFVDLIVGAVANPALADQVVADAVDRFAALAEDSASFRRDCGKRLARLFNRDLIRLDALLLRMAGR